MVVAALVLWLASAGRAAGFADAQLPFERIEAKWKTTPLADLELAAKDGDASAQCYLAWRCARGLGRPADMAEAAMWFHAAAEQGLAEAQNRLGWMYSQGQGVRKDRATAEQWLRRAADQGFTTAMSNLGWLADKEDEKYEEAAQWYRQAAERGHRHAQFLLGELHFYNKLKPGAREAEKWLRLAAEAGHVEAAGRLGELYRRAHEGLDANLPEARRWLTKAAEAGVMEAQFELAEMHELGEGGPADQAAALRWYRKVADYDPAQSKNIFPSRVPQSWARLGAMHEEGRGTPVNLKTAVWWYSRAEQANGEATFRLGRLLAAGVGVAPDDARAAECFEFTALSGHGRYTHRAMEAWLELLSQRRALPDDPEEIARIRQRVEQAKAPRAWLLLGRIAEEGILGPADPKAAMQWYRKAAEADEAEAQMELARRLAAGDATDDVRKEALQWFTRAARRLPDAAAEAAPLRERLGPEATAAAERWAESFAPKRIQIYGTGYEILPPLIVPPAGDSPSGR